MNSFPLLSPYFAGRQGQLALLQEAFVATSASKDAGVLWIGGEAGVGKTRLVKEFQNGVHDAAICVTGICVAQSESGLPYAPFTAALRHLIRDLGTEFVTKGMSFSYTNALALLLPEFGDFPVGEPAMVRARMFEAVRKLLELTAALKPVILVLEDMHWADAGSRDLLRFLVTNLVGIRILIIATYRPENDDGAVVGSLVADQARPGRGQSMILPRLTRKEVSDQLEGMLGYLPSGELTTEIFKRGAGVPLFTEAMIDSHGQLRERLPQSIRSLMSGTLEDLPQDTFRLLQAMAIGGLRVSPNVLARVMAVSNDDISRLATPAFEAKVLTVDEGSLAFRHALLRDAVIDKMLESDAAQIHAAYATTLANHPILCPMTWVSMALANHWRGADDPTRAIPAAWNAAQEARARYAYDEQLQMLEIVLDLWNEVPDACSALGMSHLQVLEQATDTACWAAEPTKGLEFVSRALTDVDEDLDAEKVVALLLQRAILRQQQLIPGEIEDLRRAESTAQRPTLLRAETLGQYSRALLARRQYAEAKRLAIELSELARAIESNEFELEAALILARLEATDSGSVDQIRSLIQRARSGEFSRLETIGYLAELDVLSNAWEHRAVVQSGLEALERATDVGQGRYMGSVISQHVADSMILLGDWDAAQRIIDRALDASPAPLGRVQLLQSAAWIACGRGKITTARNILQEVRALDATAQAHRPRVWRRLELEIWLAILDRDKEQAAADASAIPAYLIGDALQNALPLLSTAVRAIRATGSGGRPLRELMTTAAPILAAYKTGQPFVDLVLAEAAEGGSPEHIALWRRAMDAFFNAGYPYFEAYSAFRAGLAVAESGRRAEAAEFVKRADKIARTLGATPLIEDIGLLAHRARVKLSDEESEESDGQHELTARELQVLRLLAAGKRNRDIAKDLYISPKTASVHVSNILSKLNVNTRGAAAAAAHRLQLLSDR